MNRLPVYIIVVGAGNIGSQVIDLATDSANEVVVIEKDPDRAEEIGRQFDCLMLNADATETEVLLDAGAGEADAIICTTEDDATNIMVLLLAQELEIPSLVSVVQNPAHMGVFRRIGANVLENPQRLIAEYLFRAVQRPSVKDFMSLAGDAEVFEITVVEGSPIADTSLEDAVARDVLGEDVLVVAIERGQEVITPRGNTVIQSGDLVTVFSPTGITTDLMRTFTGSAGKP